LPKVCAHNGLLLLLILTPAAPGTQWRRVFSEITPGKRYKSKFIGIRCHTPNSGHIVPA